MVVVCRHVVGADVLGSRVGGIEGAVMKLALLFAFEVPEDGDVIQEMMKTTIESVKASLGEAYAEYQPEGFAAIKDSAEALLKVVKP